MNLKEIRSSLVIGDNQALTYLYLEFGDYCMKMLDVKRGCTREEAEDLFIESVMIFREKVLNGSIEKLSNTRYYIYKTCENVYLAKLKSEKSKRGKTSDVEQFFYSSGYVSMEDEWDVNLNKSASRAWGELTEKCKDILYYFYVDSLRLAEITEMMGFSTPDVTKTTKARCYKKLVSAARAYYKALKD